VLIVASEVQTARLAAGDHDLAISELPHEIALRLNSPELPWLNSLGFCTIYVERPAERVWLQVGAAGNITRAVFYRPCRWLGVFQLLDIAGFPEVSQQELTELLRRRGAHLAALHRLLPPSDRPRGAAPHAGAIINLTHDVIAALPDTAEKYFQSLGTQKRQQLPRYWRRLQREFNDTVHMQIQSGPDIQLHDIVQLVRFNQTRMESKGKQNTADIESAKQRRRWPLTKQEGLLCALRAGERLLGGTFNYVHGQEAFLIVIAHDPQLERLNIGNVSLWRTIEHLIEMGVTRYHLFWGKMRYKTEFGGRDYPVVLAAVSNRPWIANLWRLLRAMQLNVPRGLRFIRSRLRVPNAFLQ
jgi:hypothetical protein